jgi:hypothetical protein
MRMNELKASLNAALRVAGVSLFGVVAAFGQQQINLTAGPTNAGLPDGSIVPMWGYTCGAPAAGSTASCSALNPAVNTPAGKFTPAASTTPTWSPVVITVPTGQSLQINLTNSLSFANGNTVPTSLVIVGQLGGGLGDPAQRTTTASPNHPVQATTWSTVGVGPTNTPPAQGPRVQSFGTEVAAGATTALTWTTPRPGTYLFESGTHPSIQAPMGLYGMLVVTTAPTTPVGGPATAGTAYPAGRNPAVTYNADVPLLYGEIDPVQNNAVSAAVNTAGFSETMVWSGQPGGCGNPSSATYNQCYPPAVNYTPLYYHFNGVPFSKTKAAASVFPAAPVTPLTGRVLVRFANAGSRMHVPSIVRSLTGTPAVSGFSLIAEDGNPLPGVPRVQSEVFMAAGKTYDVMINAPAAPAAGTTLTALPVFDRELSLSGNAIDRDAGMLAYISINGGAPPAAPAFAAPKANNDTYNSIVSGHTLTVSDPSKGVIANDVNVYGVKVVGTAPAGLTLNTNGTFTYTGVPTSFTYCGNGATSGAACATVTLGAAPVEGAGGITVNNIAYTANTATHLTIASPGVLSVDSDAAGYPLTVAVATLAPAPGLTLNMAPNGGFNASIASCTTPAGCTSTFTYKAQNSQGTLSAAAATVTLHFPAASGLSVSVLDAKDKATLITDYRWIIEEDKTFFVNPACTTIPAPAGCPVSSTGVPLTFGVNFHTSSMPFVAQGCTGPLSCENGQTVFDPATGSHLPAVCDVGNGVCRTNAAIAQFTAVDPRQVHLDPAKRYYISVLPGDAANPFYGASAVGHTMGGAPVNSFNTATNSWTPVTVLVQPSPLPPGRLSIMVFEDDFPLNGEQDAGGGIDALSPNEPGLGGFNVQLWDDMGASGDPTGQMTYDMFNQPLSNFLAGTMDPATGLDACPISAQATSDPAQKGITGMIVTCPKYESDGITPSPLGGQAVIANLMPGRFSVVVTPGADRIARGEEWLQTNTLDGQKGHDAFIRVGEPSYFQEFGPSGYHVSIGFANPKIINDRLALECAGIACNNTVTGKVTSVRMSRTPDERLYSSGSRDAYYFTQCFISLGDPDGADFAFTKCRNDGTFTLSGIPDGDWRITIFDQWNDQIVDGLATPVSLAGGQTLNMGDIPVQQWQSNVYTRTFIDDNKDGVSQKDEAGIPLINTAVRYRDGSLQNLIDTDFSGIANFNETFPLFSWYVVETDATRYKTTGIHTVYDAGGPADGTTCGGAFPACGPSTSMASFLANSVEQTPLPSILSVPGAVYCTDANCTGSSIATGPVPSSTTNHSTSRIDPPWVPSEGWQGFSGQNNFIEFGKTPYVPGENGGIKGHVVYASTRPFDDPYMLVQTQWEPLVARVTINLYQEGTAPDGTQSLKLVDTTRTSSWDDWAQGFRSDGMPNMNCPGQSTTDLFYFTLMNQPHYLSPATALPNNGQYKCYDGMHNWNQLQPAPYDGMYSFPSVTGMNPTTGKPTGTNCTICIPNPDTTDSFRRGLPMLPAGKYVVEVILPPGYELVKEEDKNILIGDNFIAPVTQQFSAMASIFIMPDQAQIAAAYNANNAQNPTQGFGATPLNGIVPGFVPEPLWPCVGAQRIVPDYISLFPQSKQVSPFAGATRNLCDRKEVTLGDQMGATAKFFIYTSTHIGTKFTGVITDDFTSEFDPFAPSFGEKFAPPNLPVSLKDYTGNEVSRVYSDHFGLYDGMNYSTWEVNPPNPTGYSPTMMVVCMNDAGPILDTRPTILNSSGVSVPNPTLGQMITDPLFNPNYSQFCYELPFMPGTTQYMDTPVVPTSAFAGAGYNNPDCNYPDGTPAISTVTGTVLGPWVRTPGSTLTINALGDQMVNNYGYSGPSATKAPFNQKKINRHFGFGAQCTSPTAGSLACNTLSTVTIGRVPATVVSWSDAQIIVTVPPGVPACPIQQQGIYEPAGTNVALCGELLITAGNGKQSIDTVTVTVGGKAPTVITGTIQSAIDAADPGDLLIVPPGTFNEMLLMWKPVRLQGAGAASTIINANPHPAGKLDPWRAQVNCLFGIALNGTPYTSSVGSNPYDPTGASSCPGNGWNGFGAGPDNPQIDRIPLETVVGWDVTTNGNLAELLQEPTLMGAYEGAGITVLGKGMNFLGNSPWGTDTIPTSRLLTQGDCLNGGSNPYPSNFLCNPSRIDGLSITNSSQGGGGIFAHAWAHNLEISNNRIANNTGTLSGGISIGQGEFPPPTIAGSATATFPGSCVTSNITNQELPYCFNTNVNVHNNSVTSNSSIGDELFSSTPGGAGGVTFCTGSDYYKFNSNWLCGNMSSGDGGGLAHFGFTWNGDIEHNWILFNQSINPTIPTNGGGLAVIGTPDTDPVCGTQPDQDCPPGLSDGTGPGLVVNANLFQGNSAESGSGSAMRFQGVNGTEVSTFPHTPARWYSVNVTNNIITNNVAGWDGAVSLQDALVVNFINNTVASNDSTATSGVLNNTLGAPLASSPPNTVNLVTSGTTSASQPAGLVSMVNTTFLTTSFTGLTLTCPAGHPNCQKFSNPILANDVFWQNRSFHVGVGAKGAGAQNQQNVVTLFPQLNQTATGMCVNGASYWDIGVRGDTGPSNHGSGLTMNPVWSALTDAADYPGQNNIDSNPALATQYCNGSRVPPENGSMGWIVNAGIADAVVPNPVFTLTPSATVDEGNNWINMSWGPLSMTNPAVQGTNGNYGGGSALGNYALAVGSPAMDYVTSGAPYFASAPSTDFFGNPRPDPTAPSSFDLGAVEFQHATNLRLAAITPGTGAAGTAVNVTLLGTGLSGLAGATAVTVAGNGPAITVSNFAVVTGDTVTATFTIPAGASLGAHNVTVNLGGTPSNAMTFMVLAAPSLTSIAPSTGVRGAAVNVTLTGVSLTGATGVNTGTPTIAVSNFAAVNSTTVRATLTIAPGATLGAHGINVAMPGGPTNNVTFTVTGATVAFSNPTPSLVTGATTAHSGTITVTNTATGASAGPLTLTAAPTVTKVGAPGGTFSITGGTCVSGAIVNPVAGSSCTIIVQYNPGGSTTTATANVTITGTGLAASTLTGTNFTAN